MVRSAMAVAIGAPTGCAPRDVSQVATPALGGNAGLTKVDPSLDVVKKSKGPVMTLVDEFYKVGPVSLTLC